MGLPANHNGSRMHKTMVGRLMDRHVPLTAGSELSNSTIQKR